MGTTNEQQLMAALTKDPADVTDADLDVVAKMSASTAADMRRARDRACAKRHEARTGTTNGLPNDLIRAVHRPAGELTSADFGVLESWNPAVARERRAEHDKAISAVLAQRQREDAAGRQKAVAGPRRSPVPPTPRGGAWMGRLLAEGIAKAMKPLSARLAALERRCEELETRPAGLRYLGVWEQRDYSVGDVVTWSGSMWVCRAATRQRPADGGASQRDWTLAVKRGADGKDAPGAAS